MQNAKLLTLIKDNTKLESFIANTILSTMQMPYLVTATLDMLTDESIWYNLIKDSNKIALCNMMYKYYIACLTVYIDDTVNDKELEYGKIEIYRINASSGIRYATVGEISNGVMGLMSESIYPEGEEAYKNLCLLYWTFTGNTYYYRQAGFKLEYDDKRKVSTSLYEMISNCAEALNSMIDWVNNDDNVDNALKEIDKLKKHKGYKYATYEKDEITDPITIKQLTLNIYNKFPRKSDDANYRRALSLALRSTKENKQLKPMEISFMREQYFRFANDKTIKQSLNGGNSVSTGLKDECELLLRERYSGAIDPKHFAYTIITTIMKTNYSKCSPKQYSYIKEALGILEKHGKVDDTQDEKDTSKAKVISDADIDTSLASMSEAIGTGLFDDADDDFDNELLSINK